MEIKNKVILITGASSGIGKATAELLASEGAKVALAARSEDKLKEIAKNMDDSYVVKVDMTKPESIMKMIDDTFDHYDRIDVLVNNAGQGMLGSVEKVRPEDYRAIVDLNIIGPLVAMQEVIPIMKEQGEGAIINISSALSKMAIPNLGAYASTKYALNALSYTARAELLTDGIKVTALYPGLTETNFGKNSIKNTDEMWQQRGEAPKADSAEMVAEKIREAIITGPAEQFMSEEQEKYINSLKMP